MVYALNLVMVKVKPTLKPIHPTPPKAKLGSSQSTTVHEIMFCFVFVFRERERETEHEQGEGAEREEDTEADAGSRLRAVSTEPDAGLKLVNHEITTRVT